MEINQDSLLQNSHFFSRFLFSAVADTGNHHVIIMSKNIIGLLMRFVCPWSLLLFGCCSGLLLASCSATKDSYYFKTLKKDTTIKGFVNNSFESKIVKGDNLSIQVTSLSPEEDRVFNQSISASPVAAGYMVKQDGSILLHRLGNTAAEGLTRKELAEKLQAALLPFMKEPIVNVNFLNHKVTILGEIAKPQVLNMPEDQMNIIDVLVLSGDVTPNAKRNNIMIIREEGNEKKVKHINLEDHSIFTSPWYYIQPNDIVYVFPDSEKFVKEEKRRKIQTTLSLVSSVASLIFIVLSRIIK